MLGSDGGQTKRLRKMKREYLYRKSLEGKERELYEKKRKIRHALQNGTPIPTELRNEEAKLRAELDLEDEHTAVPRSLIDDEYADASMKDPKILLTTSRNPSTPLVQFVKELNIVFPNSTRMNRGGQELSDIIDSSRAHEFTDVVLVNEHRGIPNRLIVCHLPFGPTAHFNLYNVVTRHSIKDEKMGKMPEAYPHVILENLSTKVGQRLGNILKHLFPVPKPDTKRIITFANRTEGYIEFRHHLYKKPGGPKSVELEEIFPRFDLKPYKIELGTVESTTNQSEWDLRNFMNTAKKRKHLGD